MELAIPVCSTIATLPAFQDGFEAPTSAPRAGAGERKCARLLASVVTSGSCRVRGIGVILLAMVLREMEEAGLERVMH